MSATSQAPEGLPAGLQAYRRTGVFSEESLPAALRRQHSTRGGVWALIHVLEGRLRYCVPDWRHDVVLAPGTPGVVAPEVEHFVEPLGQVRMYVEFHALPDEDPGDPHGKAEG
ncbi:MAG: DUF1971 domain-containing protein [Pigmentiphaga sp.]